jgi:hypothetical protein
MAKVITLLQPWAQLVVTGKKQFETRGFNTHYRGELYIHSSGRTHPEHFELCLNDPDFKACIPYPHRLKMGYIIGKVVLEDCQPTEVVKEVLLDGGEVGRRELCFGDYGPRRWAWLLSHAELFENPIFARGSLGIWEYSLPDLLTLTPVGAYPGDQGATIGSSF